LPYRDEKLKFSSCKTYDCFVRENYVFFNFFLPRIRFTLGRSLLRRKHVANRRSTGPWLLSGKFVTKGRQYCQHLRGWQYASQNVPFSWVSQVYTLRIRFCRRFKKKTIVYCKRISEVFVRFQKPSHILKPMAQKQIELQNIRETIKFKKMACYKCSTHVLAVIQTSPNRRPVRKRFFRHHCP